MTIHHHDIDTASTQMFREKWSAYEKVVHFNYLNHKEVISTLAREISELPTAESTSLSILDIGIGDGLVTERLFTTLPVKISKLHGVDATEVALAQAKDKLTKSLGNKVNELKFIHSDMRDFITECAPEEYNVIISSYTIHHLDASPEDGKPALIKQCYRALAPGGVFLWCDVYNNAPGRNRDNTMADWKNKFLVEYEGLRMEERIEVWNHVRQFDIPEELDVMKAMLEKAGFTDIQICFDDGVYSVVLKAFKNP